MWNRLQETVSPWQIWPYGNLYLYLYVSMRRVLQKTDGRAQPTREDKMEFVVALSGAAAGHLPLRMLYFYKYLAKHADDEAAPFIDKDLFFYCEVQKFRVKFAELRISQNSNEEPAQKKLNCSVSPTKLAFLVEAFPLK